MSLLFGAKPEYRTIQTHRAYVDTESPGCCGMGEQPGRGQDRSTGPRGSITKQSFCPGWLVAVVTKTSNDKQAIFCNTPNTERFPDKTS